jgi:hypothetical protein
VAADCGSRDGEAGTGEAVWVAAVFAAKVKKNTKANATCKENRLITIVSLNLVSNQ